MADFLLKELPGASAQEDGPPPVLLLYQRQWLEDDSPLKIAEKSRRIGLTWAEASDDVLIAAAAKSAGGQNVYYVAYNQDMTVEYIQACALWARAFNYAAGEIEEGIWDDDDADKHIKTFSISFPGSGHRIVALTSRPSNLRGRQGVLVIDEAAFHDKLDELLKAALAFLIWGGKVRVISTHDGVANAFNTLVQDVRGLKRKGSVHRITFKEAVEQGLYRRVCLRKGIEWDAEEEAAWVADVYAFYGEGASEELDCVPKNSGGTYLSRALIEARMVDAPILRWSCDDAFTHLPAHIREAECRDWCEEHLKPELQKLEPLRQHYFGEDFGRRVDLTVIAPLWVDQHLRRRVPFLLELRKVPFEQQRQALFYLLDRLPRFSGGAMDASGNGMYLAEVAAQKYGATRVQQVSLSEGWYAEHMPRFKAAFEDRLIEIPRDSDVLDDIRAIQVIGGVPKLPTLRTNDTTGKRHGDAAVALCMAYAASRTDAAPIDYTSAPKHSRFDPHAQDDEPMGSAFGGRGAW